MGGLFRKLRFFIVFVVLLVGCQQEENNVEQKSTTKKSEEKVQITKKKRDLFKMLLLHLCERRMKKISQNIWSYFQRRCLVLKT